MAISTGFSLPCSNNTGGLVNVWLTDAANVTSFTLTAGAYSAVTMNGPAVFYKFEFEQDTAEYRENVSRENFSTKIDHELEFYLTKMTLASQAAIQSIIDSSTCGVIAICEDANNNKWVVGYSENFLKGRPLKISTVASTTGKAFTDGNGSTVTLMSVDNEAALTFTGTVPV